MKTLIVEHTAPFQGLQVNRDKPIQINAATLEVRDKEKKATFLGNVNVVQGDTTLKCKTLDVFYDQDANAPHPLALLRPRRERPSSRGPNERDELAPFHSITSSARASSVDGTSRPSAFAVLRLITSSYFVGAPAPVGRQASRP